MRPTCLPFIPASTATAPAGAAAVDPRPPIDCPPRKTWIDGTAVATAACSSGLRWLSATTRSAPSRASAVTAARAATTGSLTRQLGSPSALGLLSAVFAAPEGDISPTIPTFSPARSTIT